MGFSASLVNPEVSKSVAGWSWKMMEESWHMVCGQCWLLKAEGRWDGDSKIRTRRSLLWVLSGKEFPLLDPLPEADVPGSSASASGPLGCSPSPSSMLLASHHTFHSGRDLLPVDSHEAFFGFLSSPSRSPLHPWGDLPPALPSTSC